MKVLSVTVPIFSTDFESAVERYVTLTGEPIQRKFAVPAKGLSVAKIGSLLVVGGSEEALAPLRQIRATFSVDSLDDYESYLKTNGGTILQAPTKTPTGRNMIAKGADDVVIEYVELQNRQ